MLPQWLVSVGTVVFEVTLVVVLFFLSGASSKLKHRIISVFWQEKKTLSHDKPGLPVKPQPNSNKGIELPHKPRQEEKESSITADIKNKKKEEQPSIEARPNLVLRRTYTHYAELSLNEEERISVDRELSVRIPASAGELKVLEGKGLENDVYGWVHVPIGDQTVFLPRIHWGKLTSNPEGKEFYEVIKRQFVEKYGREINNWYIYSRVSYVDNFLRDIQSDLGIEVHTHSVPPKSKQDKAKEFVFFDVTFNSGSTLNGILQHLAEPHPSKFVFLVFNDIIPLEQQTISWNDASQVEVLYRLSDVIRYWPDEERHLAALLVIQAAIYGELDWHDHRVKEAIEILRHVFA